MNISFLREVSLALFLSIAFLASNAQTKLAIKDAEGLINENTKAGLALNLQEHSIEIVNMVDFNSLSSYTFASLSMNSQKHIELEIRNHKDKLLGKRSFENDLRMANDQEKVVLLSLAIRKILYDTSKAAEPVVIKEPIVPLEDQINEHNTRYFFAPTAYNLRKNEFYYNTLYFGIHDIQYGFSENFSFGMGSSIAFMPVYFTPKLSFKTGKNQTLGIGTLLGAGTYFQNWFMNLAYVNYTIGNSQDNLTLAAGYLNSGNISEYAELEAYNNKVVLSLSGMKQLGPHLYLVSENYWLNYSPIFKGNLDILDDRGNVIDNLSISANYQSHLLMGFLGTRWVMKKNDTRSWQFGIVYFNDRPFGESDLQKQISSFPYNEYDFSNEGDPFSNTFIILPAITYTYKWGYKMK